ncbi:predicted protein, partial [Nematostella vectensis]
CKKTFKTIGGLGRHCRKLSHSVKCTECGEGFLNENEFQNHKKTHQNSINTCDICHKTFAQAGSLTIHYRRHSNEKHFKCSYCNKRFVESGDMRKH